MSFDGQDNTMFRLAIYLNDLEKPNGLLYMRRQEKTTELIMAKFLITQKSKPDLQILNN